MCGNLIISLMNIEININPKNLWNLLFGFWKKVQIISPPEVREEFAVYLDKIREMY